jgi:hypothetical protein
VLRCLACEQIARRSKLTALHVAGFDVMAMPGQRSPGLF